MDFAQQLLQRTCARSSREIFTCTDTRVAVVWRIAKAVEVNGEARCYGVPGVQARSKRVKR